MWSNVRGIIRHVDKRVLSWAVASLRLRVLRYVQTQGLWSWTAEGLWFWWETRIHYGRWVPSDCICTVLSDIISRYAAILNYFQILITLGWSRMKPDSVRKYLRTWNVLMTITSRWSLLVVFKKQSAMIYYLLDFSILKYLDFPENQGW